MLDPKFIREHQEEVQTAINNKKIEPKIDIQEFLQLEDEYKQLMVAVQELRTEQNNITDKIKATSAEEKQQFIDRATEIKQQLQTQEEALKQREDEYETMLLQIPNVTSPDMPIGEDEDDNVVTKQWGNKPEFNFTVKDHLELGENLDLIDVETAAQISGARFYYLKNEAVQMQFGLVQFVFNTLLNADLMQQLGEQVGHPQAGTFKPMLPPMLMRPDVMQKMDRLDPIDDRFQTKHDELMLIGSAEHTLGPLHMDQTFNKNDLPIRYVGYSTAFRREAGSYGRDTRGILRAHQFDKLEMETFVPADQGEVEQKFIVAIQEYLVQQLEIPYQLVHICTGDTGKPDYDQWDIECWIPSQNKYRETHTSDFMTDYQSRRLNIRYHTEDGEKEYVHMNDATAFAIGRILIAILENNQQADGSVKVPQVLQPYVGKELITA